MSEPSAPPEVEAPAAAVVEDRPAEAVIDRRAFNAYRDRDEDPRGPRRLSEREQEELEKEERQKRRLIRQVKMLLKDEEFQSECEEAGINAEEAIEGLKDMDLDELKELKADIMDIIMDSDFAHPVTSAVNMAAPRVELFTTTHPAIRAQVNLKGLQKMLKENTSIRRMLRLADVEVSSYINPGPVIGSILAIGGALVELNASNQEHDVIKAYVKDHGELRPIDLLKIEEQLLKASRKKVLSREAIEAAVQKEAKVKLKVIQAEIDAENEAVKLGVPAANAHLLGNEDKKRQLKMLFNKKLIAQGRPPEFPDALPPGVSAPAEVQGPHPEEERKEPPPAPISSIPGYVDWRTATAPIIPAGPSLSAPPPSTLPGLPSISELSEIPIDLHEPDGRLRVSGSSSVNYRRGSNGIELLGIRREVVTVSES